MGDKIALVYKVLPIGSVLFQLTTIATAAFLIRKILLVANVYHFQRPIFPSAKYPPISFAVIGGLLCLLIFKFSVNAHGMNLTQYLGGVFLYMNTTGLWWFVMVLLLADVYDGYKSSKLAAQSQQKETQAQTKKVEQKDNEVKQEGDKAKEGQDTSTQQEKELIDWLATEKPNDVDKKLLFDHDVFVERILVYLGIELKKDQSESSVQNDDKGLVTSEGGHIALCGPFGAGKSSIVAKVVKELTREQLIFDIKHAHYCWTCWLLYTKPMYPWICVTCSTWGRDSASVSGDILKSTLAEMAKFVDVSAILKIPQQYVAAMKDSSSLGKVFSHFFTGYQNPIDILKNLDELLTIINFDLLIVIEDIDRNNEPQKVANELAALLDQLKDLQRVNFIIAFGYDEQTSAIVSRVCEYREDIPLINAPLVIAQLVNAWIARAEGADCILPGYSPIDINTDKPKFAEEVEVAAQLLDTPRVFKQALRRVDVIWQKSRLLGEIDLNQLILFNAVRAVAPDKVEFLYKSIDKNQHKISESIGDKSSMNFDSNQSADREQIELINEFLKRLNKQMGEQEQDTEDNRLINRALVLLRAEPDHNKVTQKIFDSHRHASYFHRVLMERVGNAEPKDQDFIKKLKGWNKSLLLFEVLNGDLKDELKTVLDGSHSDYANFLRFFIPCFEKEVKTEKQQRLSQNYLRAFLIIVGDESLDYYEFIQFGNIFNVIVELCELNTLIETFEDCLNKDQRVIDFFISKINSKLQGVKDCKKLKSYTDVLIDKLNKPSIKDDRPKVFQPFVFKIAYLCELDTLIEWFDEFWGRDLDSIGTFIYRINDKLKEVKSDKDRNKKVYELVNKLCIKIEKGELFGVIDDIDWLYDFSVRIMEYNDNASFASNKSVNWLNDYQLKIKVIRAICNAIKNNLKDNEATTVVECKAMLSLLPFLNFMEIENASKNDNDLLPLISSILSKYSIETLTQTTKWDAWQHKSTYEQYVQLDKPTQSIEKNTD